MQNTISPNRKKELIKFLFNAKLEELKKGNIKAVQTLDDAIHFASLDPADPEYAEKLLGLRKRMRLYELITKAEEVIKATGDPLCFDDAYTAIREVIESAAASFAGKPCPKHAADLLGLIRCRDLLLGSEPIVYEVCDGGEAGS